MESTLDFDGAVAALLPTPEELGSGYSLGVWDTPTGKTGTTKKSKRIYFPAQMVQRLERIWEDTKHLTGDVPLVFIERVHSMPKQGVASSFNFGMGYGLWQGIVAGLGWPMELVTPQQWMKVMMTGQLKGKDAGRGRAMELWPEAVEQFKRVKDNGRADAALLAEFGRRTYNAEYGTTSS